MDIHGALSRTKNGKSFVIIFRGHFSTLTTAISTSKTTDKHTRALLFYHLILLYAIHDILLMASCPHFVRKFVVTLCGLLAVNHLKTRAYHSENSGRMQGFIHNQTCVARIQYHVEKHEDTWDIVV